MSDIVERLREAAASLSEIYPDYAEAADEISRLRADIAAEREQKFRHMGNSTKLCNELIALRAENERLREALKDLIEEDEYQTCSGEEDDGIVRAAARALIKSVTKPVSPWRDIESAPKDGTAVVGCSTYKNKSGNLCYDWIADGYFDERGDWYFASFDLDECDYSEVTHWMPLPEPPQSGAGNE